MQFAYLAAIAIPLLILAASLLFEHGPRERSETPKAARPAADRTITLGHAGIHRSDRLRPQPVNAPSRL